MELKLMDKHLDTWWYQLFSWAWFSPCMNILGFSSRATGPAFFPLGVCNSIAIIITVDLVCCLLPGFLAVFGPKLGMRAMVQARFSWGYFGAIIPAILNVFSLEGFLILNCTIGRQMIASLSSQLDDTLGIHILVGTRMQILCLVHRRIMLWKSLVGKRTISEVLELAAQKLCKSVTFDANDVNQALAILSQRFGLDICLGHPNAVSYLEKAVASYLCICFLTMTKQTNLTTITLLHWKSYFSTNMVEPLWIRITEPVQTREQFKFKGGLDTMSSLHNDSIESNSEKQIVLNPSLRERACILHKINWHLLPFVTAVYLFSYLDWANIGNAKVAGMATNLYLTSFRYNIAAAVFFILYSFAEVPSNIALKLLRPSRWIITCTTAMVVNESSTDITALLIVGVIQLHYFWFKSRSWNKSSMKISIYVDATIAHFLMTDALSGSTRQKWLLGCMIRGDMILLVGVMLEVDVDIITLLLVVGVVGSLCLYYATGSISFSFLIVSHTECTHLLFTVLMFVILHSG
ncbi:hypothetical protein BDR06DRAFT_970030 [Suillus hirtellus]|nr:hypothetical protein BDR06DRAFT_970030 [Suillus hirtellus]